MGVERYEQVVQKPTHNTRQSVDGRILGQGFHVCHMTS